MLIRDTLLHTLYTRALQVVTKDNFGFALALTFALGITPYVLFLLRRFPMSSVCILATAAVCTTHLGMTTRKMSGTSQLYSPETASSHSWQSTFFAICENPQTYLSIPAPFFIVSLVSHLRVVSRSKVRSGHRRVEWTCVSRPASFEGHSPFKGLIRNLITVLGMW